jgi:hypothetical protein
VMDLSGKLQSLTEELAGLNVVFGETVVDPVDAEAQWPRMLPHVESMMKADRAVLYLTDGDSLKALGGPSEPDAPGSRRWRSRRPSSDRPSSSWREMTASPPLP